ncbi:uncharacterized protein BKA55DRAFT_693799 [Fusarium redolens]|uniref:Uncharacterized protein n=1 Tax=Fusarium redolens TaxID=48865 RepID=A0A9P9JX59_FUSRE|nr:uncharacterized protein BKA55DRAFT_693799 [Fusarium redolens]KAH7240268.1 hypothetical protein BKA55DRAFT_693799 [Fusarium redolens]
MNPYNAAFNIVVKSKNRDVPMHYPGYHQSNVVRSKPLDRLKYLSSQKGPWLLFLAPTSPHVDKARNTSNPLLDTGMTQQTSGLASTLPSTRTDLLPTLLDIAKLPLKHWPDFLDGRSLLQQWKKPHKRDHDAGL